MSKNKAQSAFGQSGRKGKTQKSCLRPLNQDFFNKKRRGLKLKEVPSALRLLGGSKIEKMAQKGLFE